MGTSVFLSLLKILWILFFVGFFSISTAQSKEEFREKYSGFYLSNITKVSPGGQWVLMHHTNGSNIDKYELLKVSSKKTSSIPAALNFEFTDENHLAYHLSDQTVVFRNSVTGKENGIKEITMLQVFQNYGKSILRDEVHKRILVTEPNGNMIWQQEDITYAKVDEKQSKLYFTTSEKWGVFDIVTGSVDMINIKKKTNWLTQSVDDLVSMTIEPTFLEIFVHHLSSGTFNSTEVMLPNGFKMADSPEILLEVREDRFLFIPVQSKFSSTETLSIVYYTNQNSALKKPLIQLAIYDLQLNRWKWIPDANKPYQQQILLNDRGDFIQYDLAENKVDTLNNPKTKIELIRQYGQQKMEIKNQYYNHLNFLYDETTHHFLYFEKGKWWAENLNDGTVKRAPFGEDIILQDESYSGLADYPAGALVPDKRKGHFLVKAKNNLYLWDVINNRIEKFTKGRNTNDQFEMLEKPLWKKGASSWTMIKADEVAFTMPIFLKVRNSLSDESGLVLNTVANTKVLVYGKEKINFVSEGKNVLYATYSYNQPFALYHLKNNKTKLVYRSRGIVLGELPKLEKKLIHYKVNEKILNAYLLYPENYDNTKQYPLIVQVYENITQKLDRNERPALNSFSGIDLMHYALNGYFVLLPDLDYGVNDGQETMVKAISIIVDKIKENPMIDKKNMAIVGNSFGGYEASLFMGRTDLFKTAVIGVPITDVIHNSFSVNRIANTFRPDFSRVERQQLRMNTHTFENWDGYLKASPMYYIPYVKRPVLLWGGGKDTNVNPDQVRSYFLGLKRLQKKAVYLDYPNEGHAFTNPIAREDLNYKIWQWMEFMLKQKQPADWILPMQQ